MTPIAPIATPIATRAAAMFVALLLLGAAPSCPDDAPCANDSDCASDAICLVDLDGPRCVTAGPGRAAIVVREVRAQMAPLAHGGRLTLRPVAIDVRP